MARLDGRIRALDGLRTIAAFGVLWIHAWSFYGNPDLNIGFDIFQLMAIGGNGVDFFFVISGFCMYLVLSAKEITIKQYLLFLYRRFLRIAPAFYASVVVYAVLIKLNDPGYPMFGNVLFHFLFLNNITGNNISGPLWSIGTEWHFYMFLPFLLLAANRFSLLTAIGFLSFLSVAFFMIVNLGYLSYEWW